MCCNPYRWHSYKLIENDQDFEFVLVTQITRSIIHTWYAYIWECTLYARKDIGQLYLGLEHFVVACSAFAALLNRLVCGEIYLNFQVGICLRNIYNLLSLCAPRYDCRESTAPCRVWRRQSKVLEPTLQCSNHIAGAFWTLHGTHIMTLLTSSEWAQMRRSCPH